MNNDIDTLIEDLQIKFAFQEETLKQLNDVICDQQRQIDELRNKLKQVNQKVKDIDNHVALDPKDEPPPPHY